MKTLFATAFLACTACAAESIDARIAAEQDSLVQLCQHLHAHPELSFHEEKTSARMAEEMRAIGLEVTEKVGGWGVVAVLKNGPGKTVLMRADMDGLPVRELTLLPFASKVTTKDDEGNVVSTMHACGHDIHMACWVGTARVMAAIKDQWKGTIVFIGQPAEERGGGADAMLKDGLYERFPKPEACLALHDSSDLSAGKLGITVGPATASADMVDITVHGVGGHGAQPHTAKDPIVLAAQIILALQTIDSREIHPLEPVVVTVGKINGGTKHNIIPDVVELGLTVRTTSNDTRDKVMAAIKRICRGQGISAGLPEELLPEVKLHDLTTPVLVNDPAMAIRLRTVWEHTFGKEHVVDRKLTMGGEDFSRFGMSKD
jgi:hippurate hydrolase